MPITNTSRRKKVKELGQIFTPVFIVDFMLDLRKNEGRILEPSCGPGYFSQKLKNCTAIEIDKAICPAYSKNIDFFAYSTSETLNTII